MGFPVIVFETLSEPGGMLRVGIPEYRLPKKIVDVEIEQIKDLGVEIRTKIPVNRDLFKDLLKGGEISDEAAIGLVSKYVKPDNRAIIANQIAHMKNR